MPQPPWDWERNTTRSRLNLARSEVLTTEHSEMNPRWVKLGPWTGQ